MEELIAQLLAGVGGKAIGEAAGAGAQDKSNQSSANALAQLQGLDPVHGAYNQLGAQEQQDSSLNSYQDDPALKNAQMQALQRLQQIGSSNGMMPEDQARLEQGMNASNANERGQRGAILQNMASRGISGSGQELAGQLAGTEGSAVRNHMAGTQAASDASQRALQAIMGAGAMGGNIRNQDFGEAARKAQAQDSINQFNANMRFGANQAQVGQKNTEYGQSADKAAGVASQYNQQAANQAQEAERQRQLWSGMGAGVSGGVGAYGQYANNKKKDGQ